MMLFLYAASLWAVIAGQVQTSTQAGAGNDAPDARERALVKSARMETILELALERNPHLRESRERAGARREGARARSRLPDLELKYEQWGVPLRRPWGLDQADTLMLGLRQTFPAPGTLDARERAALAEAASSGEVANARALDLVQDARRAYADYSSADSGYRIHLDHFRLAEEVVCLARSNYQSGRGDQADVLRAVVDVSRLHKDIAAIEQERLSAAAFLNTLMDRPATAVLGPPVDLTSELDALDGDGLEDRALHARPEVKAAEDAVRKSESDVDAAKAGATWPSFMVGVDYWFMPIGEVQHAYGAMVAMTLPWLSPRHGEELREAERDLAADKSAVASAKNTVLFELRDRLARHQAQKRTLAIIDERLVPESRRAFEAARASFASGQGSALALLDALRALLDVQLEAVRVRAELFKTWADAQRAAGIGVPEARGSGGDDHD